jgi:hypothetical protein
VSAAADFRFQKMSVPIASTRTTAPPITQRNTPDRWPLNQLKLLAVAWAKLSVFNA